MGRSTTLALAAWCLSLCSPASAPRAQFQDSLARRADSLVRAGHPWRATVLLSDQMRSPGSGNAEQRLVAARAASAWEGWSEVQRILGGQPWLDNQFGGEARELMAR